MKKEHRIIPIFIPHMGCKHECIFCNQRAITGQDDFLPDRVTAQIDRALATIDSIKTEKTKIEIAFFGGSFTGIDRNLMIRLLRIAESYRKAEKIHSVRCSTRPDYIDPEVLDILASYGVQTIEIGIQSLSDKVLSTCKRGHLAESSMNAMQRIRSAGFSLVGQMMLGLPFSTTEDEIQCAQTICAYGAIGTRIYPTAVFQGTKLHQMMLNGEYDPLNVGTAVKRCVPVMDLFLQHRVNILRIGLCETDSLHGTDGIVAGVNHPAFGELCRSELYYQKICTAIDQLSAPYSLPVTVAIPKGKLSQVIGQWGRNRQRICEKYALPRICFREDPQLNDFEIRILSEAPSENHYTER